MRFMKFKSIAVAALLNKETNSVIDTNWGLIQEDYSIKIA